MVQQIMPRDIPCRFNDGGYFLSMVTSLELAPDTGANFFSNLIGGRGKKCDLHLYLGVEASPSLSCTLITAYVTVWYVTWARSGYLSGRPPEP